ncbi:11833_t:CDS:2 [Scutellospora calospora]|uniref:11833_t:CDS:1 n=1 Tax=Scutellospora calospora TaxID=85575 RepID=A0ACA9LAK3_9GLOM|nr:11833_t:CDS:2 [Scutellospora calospora]
MHGLNLRTKVQIFNRLLYTDFKTINTIITQTKKPFRKYFQPSYTFSRNIFDISLPNKNEFIQALRKQSFDTEPVNTIKRDKADKHKKDTEAAKAFNKINETEFSRFDKLQTLEFYKNLNNSYSLKRFYLNLITCLLRQCANHDRLDLVDLIFKQFVKDIENNPNKHLIGISTINVWNMFASIYYERGLSEEVEIMFNSMSKYTVSPNAKTFSILIKSMAKSKNPDYCFTIIEKSIMKGLKLKSGTLNILLNSCLSSQQPFNQQQQKSINIILDLMSHWNVGPNGKTFEILLIHCRDFDNLEKIWSNIVNLGFHNDQTLHIEIIKTCLRLSSSSIRSRKEGLSKCFDYLLRLNRISQGELAIGAYNIFLKSCAYHNDLIRGIRVMEMMWSKNLEPQFKGYNNLLNTIRTITFQNISSCNLAQRSMINNICREYLWIILNGMFSFPKTRTMPRRLINSIILTLGRVGDIRGLIEFYEARINLENLNNELNVVNQTISNIFAMRTDHIPLDISFFNIFLKEISSSSNQIASLEMFDRLPNYIEPNNDTIEYLFFSIKNSLDFKKFGSQFCEALIRQRTNVDSELMKGIFQRMYQRIVGHNRDFIGEVDINEFYWVYVSGYIAREIINVYNGQDLIECLKTLKMFEIKSESS